MPESKLQPESLEDVHKHFFKRAWMWMAERPGWVKILAGLGLVLLLLAGARLNFFGEPYYRYARFVLPAKLSGIDASIPVVALSFGYEIEDDMSRRAGKLGETVYSGDRIYLSVQAGSNCWLSVFCVDAIGIHPVFREKLAPSLVEKGQTHTLEFSLDETVGKEIYYAVAASEVFSFEADIRPNLRQVFPQGHSKGPKFSEYHLKLPEQFTQKLVYFQHAARE